MNAHQLDPATHGRPSNFHVQRSRGDSERQGEAEVPFPRNLQSGEVESETDGEAAHAERKRGIRPRGLLSTYSQREPSGPFENVDIALIFRPGRPKGLSIFATAGGSGQPNEIDESSRETGIGSNIPIGRNTDAVPSAKIRSKRAKSPEGRLAKEAKHRRAAVRADSSNAPAGGSPRDQAVASRSKESISPEHSSEVSKSLRSEITSMLGKNALSVGNQELTSQERTAGMRATQEVKRMKGRPSIERSVKALTGPSKAIRTSNGLLRADRVGAVVGRVNSAIGPPRGRPPVSAYGSRFADEREAAYSISNMLRGQAKPEGVAPPANETIVNQQGPWAQIMPALIKMVERFHGLRKKWMRVNLSLPDGSTVGVSFRLGEGSIATRFHASKPTLNSTLKAGWPELVLAAGQRGIKLEPAEFEAAPGSPSTRNPAEGPAGSFQFWG